MPATVTNLAHYRATHPPIVRLWNAQCRLLAGWASLNVQLTMAMYRLTIKNMEI